MSIAQAKAIVAIINDNREQQWQLVRSGHRDWRLSTADMLTWHCGRRVSVSAILPLPPASAQ